MNQSSTRPIDDRTGGQHFVDRIRDKPGSDVGNPQQKSTRFHTVVYWQIDYKCPGSRHRKGYAQRKILLLEIEQL